MMKTFRYMTIAALSLLMAACSSNDDITSGQVSTTGRGIPFTATVSRDGNTTRTVLTEDATNGTIAAAWETGDELALVYQVGSVTKVTKATVTAQSDKTATITATLNEGVTEGTAVTLIYPYDAVISDSEDPKYGTVSYGDLTVQEGTLASIAEKYAICQGDGTLTIASGAASLKADVTMASQIAIWKLSLTDGTNAIKATQVNIDKGKDEQMAMVMPKEGTFSEFYVAVPAVSNGTINISAATTSEGDYTYTKTGVTLEAGKYYQSTVTMKRAVIIQSE
ncbi:MAG: hypothetical protein IJQ59_05545 [Bacteroidaceae bacterium]|nr:hypothetical protein [Bacteroidaceae bacterium]